MKKYTLLLLALLLTLPAVAAKKQLSALFGYSVFYLPSDNRPYVETYLDFDARSLTFVQESADRYRATVEVTLVVRRADTVAYVKKYDLQSPYTSNENDIQFTFLDLQRFALPNGIYDMQLTLRDKASDEAPFVVNEKLVVYYSNGKTSMSNVQLMASVTRTETENMLSRNGWDMVPYINDFVPAEVESLYPYFEIYNLNKEIKDQEHYEVNVYFEQRENGRRVDGVGYKHRYGTARMLDPVAPYVDIRKLPSGNYNMVVEVDNDEGQPLFKKSVGIQRSNPQYDNVDMSEAVVSMSFASLITDEEQMNHYLDALYPISSDQEISAVRALLPQKDLAAKQSFFYRFWVLRSPLDPEGKWVEYRTLLKYVDDNFSYPRTPGHRTERGRVYLQYGPPDHVRDEKNFVGALHIAARPHNVSNVETVSEVYGQREDQGQGHIHYLPYIIWQYNQLPGDYENRVFLFWDEHRSGYYKLLNSNARGELRTAGWERMLSRGQLDEDVIGEVGEQFERGY